MTPTLRNQLLGLIGAVGGGVVGYFAFVWIWRQGFYAGALPGAMVGIGCGLLAQGGSRVRGILCGLAGLGLGIYSDWCQSPPFKADPGLGYYVVHLYQVELVTLILIGLGGFLSYWFGRGQLQSYEPRSKQEPTETSPER